MGQAKIKQRAAFAPHLIATWEAEGCVNFAFALARLTGWLLHVDWWTPSTDYTVDTPIEKMRPLRVYVADNHDLIFDVRGVKSIVDFNEGSIAPLARKFGSGGVRTRFYDELGISALQLQFQIDEEKIAQATEAIKENSYFLAAIPLRQPPVSPRMKLQNSPMADAQRSLK